MKCIYLSPEIGGVRVCDGPLLKYIGACYEQAKATGYRPSYIMAQLRVVSKLNRWMRRTGRRARDLSEELIGQFLRWARRKRRSDYRAGDGPATRLLLGVLRERGVIGSKKHSEKNPARRMMDKYRRFLEKERGLAAGTIYYYAGHAAQFLSQRFGDGPVRLARLKAGDVAAFVREGGRANAPRLAVAMRSFLRFARLEGRTDGSLEAGVPRVANWRLGALPRHVAPGEVERVLARCDRTGVAGRRERAILLLLARLGLRGGEVAALQLEDIDWEKGEIIVRSKKGGGSWGRLPLPGEVGAAIADYLRKGRPRCACRNVFIRLSAPYRGFAGGGMITAISRKALKRAGVKLPRMGAHVFRHTLATGMLGKGMSLEAIGRVLRHKSPDTTAIYAKVEMDALRRLAQLWAGGAR